ncbi:MAG: ribokinase [Bacillota bacterium]
MDKNIVVVGSLNMDYVVTCKRLPRPGETLPGSGFARHPGGKGANQAAAAGKLGAGPTFIGARGEDEIGQSLEENLKSLGVKPDLKLSDAETGSAHITVTADGQNHIILITGANGRLHPEDIQAKKDIITQADYLLLQLEIPLETVIKTAELAHEAGAEVILDPAPAQKIPPKLLQLVDYLLPNEEELKQLTAGFVDSKNVGQKERAKVLLESGVKNILLTRGAAGVLWLNGELEKTFPAPEVEVVDTTAAGDAFAGALACGLGLGLSLEKAIKLGVYYGSAAVTRPGAQSSLLSRAELLELMPETGGLLK